MSSCIITEYIHSRINLKIIDQGEVNEIVLFEKNEPTEKRIEIIKMQFLKHNYIYVNVTPK